MEQKNKMFGITIFCIQVDLFSSDSVLPVWMTKLDKGAFLFDLCGSRINGYKTFAANKYLL